MTLSSLFLLALSAAEISTLIGTGQPGFSPTQVNNPYGLVIGPDQALYFCDIGNHVIRRYNFRTRTLETIAGTGRRGFSGAGGPATQADLDEPYELRFDRQGNLYFVDMKNHVVQRIDKTTRLLTTIAGTGQPGFSGDGGPATQAQLRQPHSIVFDRQGRLLICDIGNHRIRRYDPRTGQIETYLGTGEKKNPQDGDPLDGTPLYGPRAIEVAKNGTLYIVLREGNAVYEADPRRNRYRLLVNQGIKGPKGIALGPGGKLYLADTENHLVQAVDPQTKALTRIAGNGQRGDSTEANPLGIAMNRPHGVYIDGRRLYIADSEAHKIRWMLLP
ncbi:MAG: SMP-30/gluconolactonase/LRE family protein [Bryobacter sp.]|nr:SMP-30/gluconolactonase/LRE family protein [Bryobacter sp.]